MDLFQSITNKEYRHKDVAYGYDNHKVISSPDAVLNY